MATASASTIDVADGAAITVANLTATWTLVDIATLLTLTLKEQANDIDFSVATSMTTLDYTGKLLYNNAMDTQTNMVTITSSVLQNLVIGDGYIGSLTVSGAAALTEITTAGAIVNTTIHANSALTEISLGHDHLEGERAATVVVTTSNYNFESEYC